jgi:hypothetical protein
MAIFSLGLGVTVGLLCCELVQTWALTDEIGCSFRDAIWLLNR